MLAQGGCRPLSQYGYVSAQAGPCCPWGAVALRWPAAGDRVDHVLVQVNGVVIRIGHVSYGEVDSPSYQSPFDIFLERLLME